MALFVIICKDRSGALDARLATRPTHLDYLNQSHGLKMAGALLGDDGNPIGSLLIVEAEDLAAAQAQADNDPFTVAGVFESVEVRPWRVAIGSL